MWTFGQQTGEIRQNGQLIATGYAGRGEGKNNPAMQDVHDTGPLPRGVYIISPPYNHPKLGQYVMALTPAPQNQMFGRAGFYIHGDSIAHPGEASEGCIVADYGTRQRIWKSTDHQLLVIET